MNNAPASIIYAWVCICVEVFLAVMCCVRTKGKFRARLAIPSRSRRAPGFTLCSSSKSHRCVAVCRIMLLQITKWTETKIFLVFLVSLLDTPPPPPPPHWYNRPYCCHFLSHKVKLSLIFISKSNTREAAFVLLIHAQRSADWVHAVM